MNGGTQIPQRDSVFQFLRHYEVAFALRIVVGCFLVLVLTARFG